MTIRNYSDYQQAEASEKVGLLVMQPTRRLMGWALDSGSVYKLTSFSDPVIVAIEDSGVALTAAASRAAITAGKYYYDRSAQILYLQTSDSVNPNGKFIALTFQIYFANMSIILPNDLNTGYQVEWLPLFKSSSQFGVNLDHQQQMGVAIEGTGTIELLNDQSFWQPIWDKYNWANTYVFIYSWNRQLAVTEAKLIFKGQIEDKHYEADKISFTLKDTLKAFRSTYPLNTLSLVGGAILPDNLQNAYQRRIFGYINGFRPTNIDQLVNGGYAITGTASISSASNAVTGAGTNWLTSLNKDDQLSFGTSSRKYTVQSISTDTALLLTENISDATASGLSITVYPSKPKTYTNRKFLIAGHPIKSPSANVLKVVSSVIYQLSNTDTMYAGDEVIINGTEAAILKDVNGFYVTVTQIPQTVVTAGMAIARSAVQNVYLNQTKLTWSRDYTYDCSASKLTLASTAEINVAPIESLTGNLALTSGSQTVVGTGTLFTSQLEIGNYIGVQYNTNFFEVIDIADDTHLTLRSVATVTASGAAQVKRPEFYEEGSVILTCSVIGATDDGTTTGNLIYKGADIVKQIVTDLGLSSYINASVFSDAAADCPYRMGLAIPTKYDDRSAPIARDVINQINESAFGAFLQSADFQFEYKILTPSRPSTSMTLTERDILKWTIDSLSKNLTSQVKLSYNPREYDRSSEQADKSYVTAISDNATYLSKIDNVTEKTTLLVDQDKAQFQCNRWTFLLEMASTVVKLDTKLQTSRVEIGDKIQISHEKLFQRLGSNDTRKVAAVQAAKRGIGDSNIELEDLSNAMSRCAVICAVGTPDFSASSANDRAFAGYYTDTYGMISNDPNTFGTNLIW